MGDAVALRGELTKDEDRLIDMDERVRARARLRANGQTVIGQTVKWSNDCGGS